MMTRKPALADATNRNSQAKSRNGNRQSCSNIPRSGQPTANSHFPRKTKKSNECQIVQTIATDGTLVVHVPLTFARRSGRKRIITPDGRQLEIVPPSLEVTALVKALARAHRWQTMTESGDYGSLRELAVAEGVTPSYLARILRLTLLAPDIVELIMQNPKTTAYSLGRFMQPFPFKWAAQIADFT